MDTLKDHLQHVGISESTQIKLRSLLKPVLNNFKVMYNIFKGIRIYCKKVRSPMNYPKLETQQDRAKDNQ